MCSWLTRSSLGARRVSQERNRSDYAWYKMKRLQKGKDDQKQQFQQAYEQCVHELEREREARQQTEAAQEELRQEMQHLKQKYQEEARKVHAMQETIISLKRKRQDASSTMNSPLHPDLNHRPPGVVCSVPDPSRTTQVLSACNPHVHPRVLQETPLAWAPGRARSLHHAIMAATTHSLRPRRSINQYSIDHQCIRPCRESARPCALRRQRPAFRQD
eukprot:scaffold499_cov129-Isochrysis_galbana.AAC.3